MDRYTLIESYLMNVMSEADKMAFEKRMVDEPGLRVDVEAHAKMKMVMNDLVGDEVRGVLENEGFRIQDSELEEVNSKFKIQNSKEDGANSKFKIQNSKIEGENSKFKVQNSNSRARRYRLMAMLGAVGMVVLALFFWKKGDVEINKDYNQIFVEYYNAPLVDNTRDGFINVVNSEIDSVEIIYKNFHKFINSENYSSALTLFENYDFTKEHRLNDNISWFMALVKLKINPKESVIEFKNLSKYENHKYADKIDSILSDLD